MGHPVLRTVASEALLHSSPWKWGVFRALGVQWRVYEYIEGTTVDPEVKSKMKIEVKEQLDVRDANIIRTPDRLWEDLQS